MEKSERRGLWGLKKKKPGFVYRDETVVKLWLCVGADIRADINADISADISADEKCYRTREEAGQVVETNLPEIMVKILG